MRQKDFNVFIKSYDFFESIDNGIKVEEKKPENNPNQIWVCELCGQSTPYHHIFLSVEQSGHHLNSEGGLCRGRLILQKIDQPSPQSKELEPLTIDIIRSLSGVERGIAINRYHDWMNKVRKEEKKLIDKEIRTKNRMFLTKNNICFSCNNEIIYRARFCKECYERFMQNKRNDALVHKALGLCRKCHRKISIRSKLYCHKHIIITRHEKYLKREETRKRNQEIGKAFRGKLLCICGHRASEHHHTKKVLKSTGKTKHYTRCGIKKCECKGYNPRTNGDEKQ